MSFLNVSILALLVLLGACDKADGKMAKVGDIATIHFTGKTADGKVFEATEKDKPRQVHIGANLILPALEQALIGMKTGEKKSITVKAEQAFGPDFLVEQDGETEPQHRADDDIERGEDRQI